MAKVINARGWQNKDNEGGKLSSDSEYRESTAYRYLRPCIYFGVSIYIQKVIHNVWATTAFMNLARVSPV